LAILPHYPPPGTPFSLCAATSSASFPSSLKKGGKLALQKALEFAPEQQGEVREGVSEDRVQQDANLRSYNMRKSTIVLAALAVLGTANLAGAAEIEVKMLNKGAEGFMVFEPSFVKAEAGDTVKFVATDKGHNVETIAGMLPEGASPVAGKMGQDLAVKFDKPGVYGVKCTPHYGMGMVAMVVVGMPTNQDTAKAVNHPGKAKQIFTAMFGRLSSQAAAK
jgi:pseudoazurin